MITTSCYKNLGYLLVEIVSLVRISFSLISVLFTILIIVIATIATVKVIIAKIIAIKLEFANCHSSDREKISLV